MRTHSIAKTDPILNRSISMPLSMFNRLDAERKELGLPLSEVTRRAIELYFQVSQAQKEKP